MPEVHFMPHQQEAIEKLRSGSILCAGVGTGKSITALGYYYIKECSGVIWDDQQGEETIGPIIEPKDLYIITTARKRDTGEWMKECERFDIQNEPNVKIVIDSWNNIHKYRDAEGAFFIFDEQRVVGSGTWVREFLRITKKNHWILLSATPGDTWMDYVPVFIANGFYKNRTEFIRRHVVYSPFVTKYPKIERFIEVGYLESLRRRITVTMKYEKVTIPHWESIVVDYDTALYKKVSEERWDPWKEEPIRDIAGACYLMRKVVNSNEQRARHIFWLVMAKHPKVIVFYNYDYELELMKETFRDMLTLDNLLEEDRDLAIAEWNGHRHEPIPHDSRRWIYLVQYAAGSEGWNCVETDTIIFYSQNYSYKAMTQAAGRIDRLNTPFRDLYYYTLKSSAPIDKAIDRALKTKRNFNEKLFIKEW